VLGKLCIEVNPGAKAAFLSEELCIGCGICVKVRRAWRGGATRAAAAHAETRRRRCGPVPVCVPLGLRVVRPERADARAGRQKCPFEAIMIINLPKDLERDTTHRYGPNSFKLHRCA
jgi:ATP-binding cassette subfamily E protein 1